MKKRFLNIYLVNNKISINYYSGKNQLYNLDNVKSVFLKFNKKKWYYSIPLFIFILMVNIIIMIVKFNFLITFILATVSILFVIITVISHNNYSLIINFKSKISKKINIQDKLKMETINTINQIKLGLN